MTRTSLFGSPLFLGFEEIERAFERLSRSTADGYPPYNVEQHSETHLRVTLAVAGFSTEELSIHLERNQLVIRGKQAPDQADRQFLHRGIATRQFQRSFVLAEGIEVSGARLANGLLRVDLERHLTEPEVRRIDIATGA